MFENVLHQEESVSRLKNDVSESTLPSSLLFSGPAYSGKLTAALELARVLSCRESKNWQCSCSRCQMHRELNHHRTLIAGSRNMLPEIAAASSVLRQNDAPGLRYLYVRSVRRLLRRFDSVLWEGEEQKIRKIASVTERLSENLDTLLPGKPLPSGTALGKLLDSLIADCGILQKSLPNMLPISQIRHMTAWACHTSGGDHKSLIIDAAERMLEASKNALLKFLEEPPPDTTIILLTDRKPLLLPTIVSRLRTYSFQTRNQAEQTDVLERVFKESGSRSLSDYFNRFRGTPTGEVRQAAKAFLSAARSRDPLPPDQIGMADSAIMVRAFLYALSEILNELYAESTVFDHERARTEAVHIRNALMWSEILNIPPVQVLRRLYSSFREGSS